MLYIAISPSPIQRSTEVNAMHYKGSGIQFFPPRRLDGALVCVLCAYCNPESKAFLTQMCSVLRDNQTGLS